MITHQISIQENIATKYRKKNWDKWAFTCVLLLNNIRKHNLLILTRTRIEIDECKDILTKS